MNLKPVLFLLSESVAQANTYVICEHAEPTNVICDSSSITTYSSTDHRLAEGMDYYWGYNNRKAFDKESGYAYYNFDCYYKQFTDVSRLYLLNIRANFTSGFIADRNNENGYNWMFDLDYGYIHIAAVSNFKDKNDTSSTVKLLTSWPDSSKSTSTITSAFSTNYNNNWGSTTELSWPAGVKISGSNSGSLSWTIDHSKTITTDEPYISTQTSPRNELEQQWNYQYKDLGRYLILVCVNWMTEAICLHRLSYLKISLMELSYKGNRFIMTTLYDNGMSDILFPVIPSCPNRISD